MRHRTNRGDGVRDGRPPGLRDLRQAFAGVALFVLAVLAAAMLIPALLGYECYVITGGSMAGAYDRGSIVYAEVVPVDELRVGDVITYEPPPVAGIEGLVTHRIVSIDADRRGRPVLRTNGDANAARDPWRFKLERPEQARAVAGIPFLGYALAALSIREVRVALIGVPALLLAVALLAGLWREAGTEARQATDGRTAGGPG